jgi:tetratricopeptide (TPR) repeat protein
MEQADRTLMEQQPPSAEGLYDAAEIAATLSRPKDAEAAWQKLRTQFPDHPLTHRRAWDLASVAFKQKSWKEAAALGRVATQSRDDGVRAEAWLLVGEAELQLKRYAPAGKAFEAVGGAGEVDAGVRYRALAGLGLAREQQKEWKAALSAYESVATGSPDLTLRDWARQRATAVRAQLAPGKPANGGGAPPPKRTEPARPGDKPAGKRS